MIEYKNDKLYFDSKSVEDIVKKIQKDDFKSTAFNNMFVRYVKQSISSLFRILSKIDKIKFSKAVIISDFILNKRTTPFYIYSQNQIEKNFQTLDTILKDKLTNFCDYIICFSVKSCSNINILKILEKQGSGADVVSGGELFRAMKAKINNKKIVFAGVGKTKEELIFAIKHNILQINVESFEELFEINEISNNLNLITNVCVRINPDIDAKTHSNITTGKKDNKFGISFEESKQKLDSLLKSYKNINLIGISMHIGSQITDKKPLQDVFDKMSEAFCYFYNLGYKLQTIDFGGGLGISYNEEFVLSSQEYIDAIYLACKKIKETIPNIVKMPTVIIEPGRFISGNSGVLVSKVVRLKKTDTKNFLIVDAAMNDLIRPALYGGYHKLYPEKINTQQNLIEVDIVGPICESSCFFAKAKTYNANFNNNDIVMFANAGAYCYSMSSRYNTRPMLAEYLITKTGAIKQINKSEEYYNIIVQEI